MQVARERLALVFQHVDVLLRQSLVFREGLGKPGLGRPAQNQLVTRLGIPARREPNQATGDDQQPGRQFIQLQPLVQSRPTEQCLAQIQFYANDRRRDRNDGYQGRITPGRHFAACLRLDFAIRQSLPSSLKREFFLFSSRGAHGTIARMNSYKGCRDIGRRLAAFAALGFCSSAQALSAVPGPSSTLQEILVIGTTPVPGVNIDIDKVPGNVQSVLAGDLTQNGTARLTAALADRLGSVSISDSLADPFQPDVLYRGFAASPVLEAPQGSPVFQNHVRII